MQADDPLNQTRNLVIVTANNTDAAVILDGTASCDVNSMHRLGVLIVGLRFVHVMKQENLHGEV